VLTRKVAGEEFPDLEEAVSRKIATFMPPKVLSELEYIVAAMQLRCILVILVILDHSLVFRVIIPGVV